MKEKVILVTGGSRGIGAAIVSRFAKEGSRVYFTYHSSEDAAKALVGSLGKKAGVSYLRCDVRDRNTVEETVNKILEKEQRLDVLVNNAGIIRDNLFLTLSDEDWKEVLETNLGGVYTFCKAAAKTMITQGAGRIINISSVASGQTGIGIAGGAHYTASKGGVIGLSETLAIEWAELGINVNVIAPGAIDTPMIQEAKLPEEALKVMLNQVPLKRIGRAEEVSALVVFLASEEASYITGATFYVDGGWLAA